MLGLAALCGCRNRAYNDLYIENMAAEIRDLEDQLYEYDHEYRLLEQELASLKQQNARLSKPLTDSRDSGSSRRSPLGFLPRGEQLPIPPEPALEPEAYEPQSILENGDQPATRSPFPSDELPSPRLPSNEPTLPPAGMPPATPPSDRSNDGFNFEELVPPTIDPGEPMPPALPPTTNQGNAQRLAPENDLELNLSRIEIPGLLASQSSESKASITVATEKLTDRRVVELAFHPSLCRAINMDDHSDDDGLYLVLQPRNERGQMVPEAADLSVVVLDPNRERGQSTIGQWDYSAADVKSKMQPIGANQGIHLRLPWNGPDPSADRVIVFVRYTFENGRQVVGDKEIFVSSDGGLKTVWAPRATAVDRGPVAQAAFQVPLAPAASNVVRPEGTAPNSPAPAPGSALPNSW